MSRFEFRLPDPGEGLTEAELLKWHVSEGELIEEDEPLCTVETDKAVVEIPSPCTGNVSEIVASPSDVVAVGEVIAIFETEHPPRQQFEADAVSSTTSSTPEDGESERPDESATQAAAQRSVDTEDHSAAAPTDDEARNVFAAPSTRRYAREKGVSLTEVSGSGPHGRILRSDIEVHTEDSQPPEQASAIAIPDTDDEQTDAIRRPLQGLRRTIAENMTQSMQEIPHVTSGFEADAEAFVSVRERLEEKHEPRISYTALLAKAIVPALQEFPLLNASIDTEADEIVEYRRYDIGIATQTDDGLLVPVIESVDEKSLIEVAAELEELTQAARERDLNRSQLRGSTFTITNVGSHSSHGTFGTPIINHPEAAILGVGRITDEPVATGPDDFEVRKRLNFSLSYDHRIIDGAKAAAFAEYFIEGIEDPDILLARL